LFKLKLHLASTVYGPDLYLRKFLSYASAYKQGVLPPDMAQAVTLEKCTCHRHVSSPRVIATCQRHVSVLLSTLDGVVRDRHPRPAEHCRARSAPAS